jgi:hypothetical protein
MSLRRIYLLPAALQEYEAEGVNPAPDEACYVCYRAYGENDDGEKPYVVLRYICVPVDSVADVLSRCHAMRLIPCGHLIGSECMKVLASHGFDKCSLCATPLEGHNPVHPIIRRLAENSFFTAPVDIIYSLNSPVEGPDGPISINADHLPPLTHITRLSDEVFTKTAMVEDAITLWSTFMEEWLKVNIVFPGIILCFWLSISSVEYFCGSYIESVPLSILTGDSPSWILAIITDVICWILAGWTRLLWPDLVIGALVGFLVIVRAVGLVLSKKYFLSLVVLHTVAFGILLQVVISYGVAKSGRKRSTNRLDTRHR